MQIDMLPFATALYTYTHYIDISHIPSYNIHSITTPRLSIYFYRHLDSRCHNTIICEYII